MQTGPEPPDRTGTLKERLGLVLGPVLFLAVIILPLGLEPAAARMAAVAALMATWWLTEALPLAATALLPLALFPLLGLMSPTDAAAPYANPVIFLFLGGFLLALAMERWELHRRIALGLIGAVGTAPWRLLAAFMVATAFLSMWLSNTATTTMMLPIGLAIAGVVGGGAAVDRGAPSGDHPSSRVDAPTPNPFASALMLGIAYAATIGGMATLIGTPPNAVFAAAASELLGREVGFAEWLLVGLPLALVLLPITWALLVAVLRPPRTLPPGADDVLRAQRAALGPMSRGEKLTLLVFGLTVAGWLLREPKSIGGVRVPGLTDVAPAIDDATIAILGALLLFVIPMRSRAGEFLMDWRTTRRLPWGVLILFGGGLSLARGFETSGLTEVVAAGVAGLAGLPAWAIIFATVAVFAALSELASNTAIAALAMPILAAGAVGMGLDPLTLMAVGALAASVGYMMPVATPPNAIAFGSGYVRMGEMIRVGIWVDLVSIVVIAALAALVIRGALM